MRLFIIISLIFNSLFAFSQSLSGDVDSLGRKQGDWKSFYSNGKLKTLVNYQNGELHNGVYRYDSLGILTFPRELQFLELDSTVENSSDLKVEILFSQYKSSKSGMIFDMEKLGGGVEVYVLGDTLFFQAYVNRFAVLYDRLIFGYAGIPSEKLKLKTTDHFVNRVELVEKDGINSVNHMLEKVDYKTSLGVLTVDVQMRRCDDTGHNPIILKHESGELKINGINNLQYFEYDVNKDGVNEVYIISSDWCGHYMRIYRIVQSK